MQTHIFDNYWQPGDLFTKDPWLSVPASQRVWRNEPSPKWGREYKYAVKWYYTPGQLKLKQLYARYRIQYAICR
jgi:hypothetical protein